MSWDYEYYLTRELKKIISDLEMNVNIEVCEEQLFAKMSAPVPNTIYCVIKYLSTDIAYNSLVRPIQILIVSEGNQMQNTKILFDYFAEHYNWKLVSYTDNNENITYIKQQYSTPVVISNFNDIGYDFRSVLYLSGTLIIMENVVDITTTLSGVTYDNALSIKIGSADAEIIKPLTFQFQYNTGCDTQPVAGQTISSSVKSVSTFSLVFTIPATTSTLLTNATNISAGLQTGNTKFTISFSLAGIAFSYDCILTAFNFVTTPSNIPSLQFTFMR